MMTATGENLNHFEETSVPGPEEFLRAQKLRSRTLEFGLEDGVVELMIGIPLLVMAYHRYLAYIGDKNLDWFIAGLFIIIMPLLLWTGVRFRARREQVLGRIVEKYGPVFSRFGIFVLAGMIGMNLWVSNNNFLGTGHPDSFYGVHLAAIVWIIACLIMGFSRFYFYLAWSVLAYSIAITLSPVLHFGGPTQAFQIYGILTAIPPIIAGGNKLASYVRKNIGFIDGPVVDDDAEVIQ